MELLKNIFVILSTSRSIKDIYKIVQLWYAPFALKTLTLNQTEIIALSHPQGHGYYLIQLTSKVVN